MKTTMVQIDSDIKWNADDIKDALMQYAHSEAWEWKCKLNVTKINPPDREAMWDLWDDIDPCLLICKDKIACNVGKKKCWINLRHDKLRKLINKLPGKGRIINDNP